MCFSVDKHELQNNELNWKGVKIWFRTEKISVAGSVVLMSQRNLFSNSGPDRHHFITETGMPPAVLDAWMDGRVLHHFCS